MKLVDNSNYHWILCLSIKLVHLYWHMEYLIVGFNGTAVLHLDYDTVNIDVY